MNIETGSFWLIKDTGCIAIVDSIIGVSGEGLKVSYIVTDSKGVSSYQMSCDYNLFTKIADKLMPESKIKYASNKEYNKGKTDGYKDGYKDCSEELHRYMSENELEVKKQGYEEGYAQAYSELQTNTERERALQEKAFDEGFDQAIDALIEAGVIGEGECLDEDYSDEECYSEYEFGDVEDSKEEYCFFKELERVLDSELASNIKSGEKTGEDLDGKSRGINLGYNKRDYEHSKDNDFDFWAYLKEQDDKLIENDEQERLLERKHSHYFKDVRHLDYIDIYELNKLFPIDDDTDCILHARKKLLVCGGRGGSKDMITDITDARDTLNRYLQIEGVEE